MRGISWLLAVVAVPLGVAGPAVAAPVPPPALEAAVYGPTTVVFGSDLIYHETLANHGPGDASGVVLVNELDRYEHAVSASSTRGECSIETPARVTCAIGELAQGETVALTVVATPNASFVYSVTNRLVVTQEWHGETIESTAAWHTAAVQSGLWLAGTAGDDVLRGSSGDDVLLGRGGDDRLFGEAGADELYAHAGADRLAGGPGRDTLAGGRGRDVVRAGGGADVIHARDGKPDSLACGSGGDRVLVDALDRVAADCEQVRRRS